MKKILVVTFLIVSSIGYAQSVSLDDLISYQQSSISEINAKLIAKSWTLVKSHHDENMKDEYISGDVWTISDCIWEYDGGDIHSEIDYTYTMSLSKNNNTIFNRIKTVNYLTTSRENYLKIKDALQSKGYKEFKEDVTENGIQIRYENSTHLVKLITATFEDKTNLFAVSVQNKN